LPGDMDFFDNDAGETVSSFRAALTVGQCWAPDGRHWLSCTTAPRMNEDNGVSVYRYTNERMIHLRFVPNKDAVLRTGGGATGGRGAADAGAMLFASTWRPCSPFQYEDNPLTPRKGKAIKNLPAEGIAAAGTGPRGPSAYRAGDGGGGSSIQAMMRGEVGLDSGGDRWGKAPEVQVRNDQPKEPELTWEEYEAQKKAKKAAEKKAKQDEEDAITKAKEDMYASRNQVEKNEKKLEKLKKQLSELDGLKEKEWDELTEEDEEELEKEIELKKQIAELENSLKGGS